MRVSVLDTTKKPLAPTTPRRARLLLKSGKASVFRRYPFTIILKREIENPTTPDLKIKIDPGSRTTGVAIVNQQTGEVVFAAEIEHRGHAIKASLNARRSLRRGRRQRKTRYRKPRFDNRTRPKGWLPPSLESRIENVYTWAHRLQRIYPLESVAYELVRFDMQLMQNPTMFMGFQTGDIVKANIPNGKFAGRHVGRLSAVRQRPSFTLNGFDVHPKHLTRIHRSDGFAYAFGAKTAG